MIVPPPAARSERTTRPHAARPTLDARIQAAVEAAVRSAAPTEAEVALEAQRRAFDDGLRMQAESERESNALREIAFAQIKREDEFMRAWIKLI